MIHEISDYGKLPYGKLQGFQCASPQDARKLLANSYPKVQEAWIYTQTNSGRAGSTYLYFQEGADK